MATEKHCQIDMGQNGFVCVEDGRRKVPLQGGFIACVACWMRTDRGVEVRALAVCCWSLCCFVVVGSTIRRSHKEYKTPNNNLRTHDSDEMVVIHPSGNTDQGVLHICEYSSVKLVCAMKVILM